jgi:hypothetical protein
VNSLDKAAISNLPNNSDGVETSAALLAAVLLDHDPVITSAYRTSVLSSYESDNYIKVDGGAQNLTEPAESVIFLAPQPYADQNAAKENQEIVTIATQFDAAIGPVDQPGPLVVGAAGAAGSGNVIGAVTGDALLSKTISTVDNADTPQGQIAIVLAVNEQLVDKRAGHYGISSSATSMLPKLVSG